MLDGGSVLYCKGGKLTELQLVAIPKAAVQWFDPSEASTSCMPASKVAPSPGGDVVAENERLRQENEALKAKLAASEAQLQQAKVASLPETANVPAAKSTSSEAQASSPSSANTTSLALPADSHLRLGMNLSGLTNSAS